MALHLFIIYYFLDFFFILNYNIFINSINVNMEIAIMNQKDILERLDKMDMEAFVTLDTPDMYQMIIVGGSGLVLL